MANGNEPEAPDTSSTNEEVLAEESLAAEAEGPMLVAI